MRLIEEIYTYKFSKDISKMKHNKGIITGSDNSENPTSDFSFMIYFFLQEKFKMKKLIEQVRKII